MTADQIKNVSQAIDDAASAIHNATEWGDPYWADKDGTTILQRLITRIGYVVEAAEKEERKAALAIIADELSRTLQDDDYEVREQFLAARIAEALRKRGQ